MARLSTIQDVQMDQKMIYSSSGEASELFPKLVIQPSQKRSPECSVIPPTLCCIYTKLDRIVLGQ